MLCKFLYLLYKSYVHHLKYSIIDVMNLLHMFFSFTTIFTNFTDQRRNIFPSHYTFKCGADPILFLVWGHITILNA